MIAGVAELVDVLDLGSSAARRGGSIPSARTNRTLWTYFWLEGFYFQGHSDGMFPFVH